MNNPFVLNSNEYKRDINVLKHYINDTATYLSLMSGKGKEECELFVKNTITTDNGKLINDPKVHYLERGDNGDRVQKEGTLSQYLGEAVKERDLIAPTLTTYLHPTVKQSLLVDFIDGNVKERGTAKKKMFTYKMAGDKPREAYYKGVQTNKKLNNNSISGAHVSASTPLFNRTAHSTLTSNCRSTSGYGNANNEKFLCGNRHYWSPDIVRNNIISIINNTDYKVLESAMVQFGIRYPTAEETMGVIRYSADLYWKGEKDFYKLFMLVSKLTDIQRAAFVYTGDLYHLMKFNEQVVRTFINKLSAKITTDHPNPKDVIDNASEDNRNLANQICADDLLKAITSDKQKTTNPKDLVDTPAYGPYAATVNNIDNVLEEYSSLIKALWVTPNVPASLAVFPDSIRRCAITSDTDSTIFTVQDWVIWHCGKLAFDQKANAVSATLVFLASQTITHVLARMSANFGIEEKRIHQIAMKNEYFFPIFTPTQVAKHYFALIGCQEGNIFKAFEKEIKGVHLKSSNAPKVVMKEAEKMMLFIMNSVVEGKKININYVLKWIADIERDVMASIKKGSYSYFRIGQVKTPSSYTKGESADAYQQYLLWQEVFAPKYGDTVAPPYTSIKVGVDINTPTKTREWLASIEDKELVARLEQWLLKKGTKNFGSTLMLPEQCISTKGIPDEIAQAIGIRKIVLDTTGVFYLILETLGVYMLNDKCTKLVSDIY